MRFVSLFSGCGGLDLGLQQAGFEPLFGLDDDPYAAASHAANFPELPFFQGHVEDMSPADLEALLGDALHGEIDLLAGGPPCPPYSKSRFYLTDKPRGLDDPVGEATMAGFLKFLSYLQPRAFLLENVPGLGYGIHRESLERVLLAAVAAGYSCSHRVLNAADYGVPQTRERFFLVGMRGRQFAFPEPTHRNPKIDHLFDNQLPPWRTAGEVLIELDTDEMADDDGHFAGGRYHDLLCVVPPGENYLHFTKERGYPEPIFRWRSRYWSFLLKLSPDMPSWTIQARRSNNMGPFHWRNRILRITEVKRLQTIPDGWHLAGNIERQWRQLGNAVPPLLAKALGEALKEQLAPPKPRAERLDYARVAG